MDGYNARLFQYIDFSPIVNPRTANTEEMKCASFAAQYEMFLKRVAMGSVGLRDISARDQMAMVAYLVIQNRYVEAATVFQGIDAGAARAASAVTYDYMSASLAMSSGDPAAAVAIAEPYIKSP